MPTSPGLGGIFDGVVVKLQTPGSGATVQQFPTEVRCTGNRATSPFRELRHQSESSFQ